MTQVVEGARILGYEGLYVVAYEVF